jgi:hypothetical protein
MLGAGISENSLNRVFSLNVFFVRKTAFFPDWFVQAVANIDILRATLEEACLKKGEFFSADLHPIL